MTTLVAIPTKDSVVMGCDSLATASKLLVDPLELKDYFGADGSLLLVDGVPRLADFSHIVNAAQLVPYDHMTHVDKLISLEPLPVGVMFTGITSIGDRTLKSLLFDFKESDGAFDPTVTNYTVRSISDRLLKFLRKHYEEHFKELGDAFRPHSELIVAGYDKAGPLPKITKINIGKNSVTPSNGFRPVFGGQSREIERIVHGIDVDGWVNLELRHYTVLKRFAAAVLKQNGVDNGQVPDPEGDDRLFGEGFTLERLTARWGDFSEQNAIDCVTYFIRIMVECQRFSAQIPTVGGAIHIALINRDQGFNFISREEYMHEDHRVSRNKAATK